MLERRLEGTEVAPRAALMSVRLNVGGQHFEVGKSTLARHEGYLATLLECDGDIFVTSFYFKPALKCTGPKSKNLQTRSAVSFALYVAKTSACSIHLSWPRWTATRLTSRPYLDT